MRQAGGRVSSLLRPQDLSVKDHLLGVALYGAKFGEHILGDPKGTVRWLMAKLQVEGKDHL